MNDSLTFRPSLLRHGLLRNPASGWMLYDDADKEVARADAYWEAMDEAARSHASIFYLRWRWAEAEPEEGRYAWKYDKNFQALIQGALDRGLRLAFRFYIASRDNSAQATPDYVRRAGAEGCMQKGADDTPLWSPYVDDPVFQEKFSAFVAAFAEEFDDPARVDFIDALGLGWWGEGHHINLKNPDNALPVYRWILDTYATRFHHTLLGIQYGTAFGWETDEEWAIRGEDYVVRRDGLGSFWFSDQERERVLDLYPRHPLFGERCYWGLVTHSVEQAKKDDTRFGHRFETWRDLDQVAVEDALAYHANTFDLRTIPDVKRFMTYPEVIEDFKSRGGYRLAPLDVSLEKPLQPGESTILKHTWTNLGVGVLPNHNRRWNHKYRPAFALIPEGADDPGDLVWIDDQAEPGDWLTDETHAHSFAFNLPDTLPPGPYRLCCAVLNTLDDGMPHLRLSTRTDRHGPWHVLDEVQVGG